MKPVIVIAGPTASGKTRLSIELAKEIGGEIISADSMQVYRYMDIGTAKPDEAEMSGIKHYMISEYEPDTEFSVAVYRENALQYIREVSEKGKTPIVAGGTGLYINSLVYNINYSEVVCDQELRQQLQKQADVMGSEYLHEKLQEIDPQSALRIHKNDTKRIIRALEVYKQTNITITEHQRLSRMKPPEMDYFVFGLRMDREKLYKRIEQRVDLMFEKGLVEEVKALTKMGYGKRNTSMQGLGYKEVLAYFRGELTIDEVKFVIKRDTRHYAKRQMTWFRRLENIEWLDIEETTDIAELVKKIKYRIASSGIFL